MVLTSSVEVFRTSSHVSLISHDVNFQSKSIDNSNRIRSAISRIFECWRVEKIYCSILKIMAVLLSSGGMRFIIMDVSRTHGIVRVSRVHMESSKWITSSRSTSCSNTKTTYDKSLMWQQSQDTNRHHPVELADRDQWLICITFKSSLKHWSIQFQVIWQRRVIINVLSCRRWHS